MEILLVSALRWEIRPLLSALRARGSVVSGHGTFERFAYGRTRITARTIGVGARCSARNLQEALGRCKPGMVLLAGFSGAVHAGQKTGDVAVPAIFTDFKERKDCRGAHAFAPPKMLKNPMQRAVTVPSLMDPSDKRKVGMLWPDAFGVDLESYPLSRVCSELSIPFICVRAIFDEAGDRLPSLRNFWRLPLWYLKYRGAAESLSRAVQDILSFSEKAQDAKMNTYA